MEILSEKHFNSFEKIYCDTNIVRRLHGYYAGASDRSKRNIHDWCEKLLENRKILCISILCISEFLNSFFNNRAEKYCKTNSVVFKDMKDFKKNHRMLFRKFIKDYGEIYTQLEELIGAYKLEFVYPADGNRSIDSINQMVKTGAYYFHQSHPQLDVADAFHLSIAVYSGIRHILTLDDDFKSVRDLDIYKIQ